LLAVGALVSGCGGPPTVKEYESLQEIAALMNSAGHKCTDGTGASGTVKCLPDVRVVLSGLPVDPLNCAMADQPETAPAMYDNPLDDPVIVGGNWYITGVYSLKQAEQIGDLLGGWTTSFRDYFREVCEGKPWREDLRSS